MEASKEARKSPLAKVFGQILGLSPEEEMVPTRASRVFEGVGDPGSAAGRSASAIPGLPLTSTHNVAIRRPTRYDEDDYRELQEITRLIRERKSVIISFEDAPEENVDKIFAWIMGAMAAIGGHVIAVDRDEKFFLLEPAPDNSSSLSSR